MPRLASAGRGSSAFPTRALHPHAAPVTPRALPRWARATKRALHTLEHVHLRGTLDGLVPYGQAEEAQERHRSRFLSWKALSEEQRRARPGEEPKPRLLSFEAEPTFTLGRRQDNLTATQAARLQSPLLVERGHATHTFRPQVAKTNRGGLTTYHGPGQLVLWPIIDMHSSFYPKYGVASYAHHLEEATQRFLSMLFGIKTYTSRDEPGVWVSASTGSPRKIAALGVHHRRYITALGIAINIDVPVTGDQGVNPWARFVPCGLDGKLVTSAAAEGQNDGTRSGALETLARQWAGLFEEGMLDEGQRGGERDAA